MLHAMTSDAGTCTIVPSLNAALIIPTSPCPTVGSVGPDLLIACKRALVRPCCDDNLRVDAR
eukprot:2493276-Rhodomonas_salina.2